MAVSGDVTHEATLCLRVHRKLERGEHVLPVAFDGEFFLPLGWAEPGDGDTTWIILERLPVQPPNDPPSVVGNRSLVGSIRIYFQKLLSPVMGFDYPYPALAAVTLDGAGNVSQEADPEHVRRVVQGANRVLLYIHGIIGETRTMVPTQDWLGSRLPTKLVP